MRLLERIASVPRDILVFLIVFYQRCLSPFKPRCCRFVPSCSEYGRQSLLRFGLCKGGLLTIWRVLRCQPFYHGPMYDPVPEVFGLVRYSIRTGHSRERQRQKYCN